MIYHLLADMDWEAAADPYFPAAFAKDGFIHCSEASQVEAVADRHYAAARRLSAAEIDDAALGANVRREDLYGLGEDYPHIYGSLPKAAVKRILPMLRDAEGHFRLPPGSVPLRGDL